MRGSGGIPHSRSLLENPELWSSLERQKQKLRVLVSPDNTGIAYGRPEPPGLMATLAAIGREDNLLAAVRQAAVRRDEAQLYFLLFLSNPLRQRLAGPCARCGAYYLKKRASQKVYCSRRCGNAATAVTRTRERLEKEHARKLRRARTAMQKWTTAHTTDDWKVFVSEREPDITPKFLTRAVNKGELTPPVRQ